MATPLYIDHAAQTAITDTFTGIPVIAVEFQLTLYQMALLTNIIPELINRWRYLDEGLPVDDTLADEMEKILVDLIDRLGQGVLIF